MVVATSVANSPSGAAFLPRFCLAKDVHVGDFLISPTGLVRVSQLHNFLDTERYSIATRHGTINAGGMEIKKSFNLVFPSQALVDKPVPTCQWSCWRNHGTSNSSRLREPLSGSAFCLRRYPDYDHLRRGCGQFQHHFKYRRHRSAPLANTAQYCLLELSEFVTLRASGLA